MAELNLRKRGTKWEYRFEAAKIDGKRNQISKGGFKTKKEALEFGTKALAEYNSSGLHFTPSEISCSDFFDYWLETYCKNNLADSTYTGYSNIIKNHIKPSIGSYKLNTISPIVIQNFINDICLNKGFSSRFNQSILKLLKNAFAYAVLPSKFITFNPAESVTLPKTSIKKLEDDIIILSKQQVSIILDRFESSKYQYMALLTAYYTGLRVGEVYGLTWDDIDFEKKLLSVRKNAKKIEREGSTSDGKRIRGTRGKATTRWYFGECKTKSSYREILIGETLINALIEYKKWQEENEIAYSDLYTKHYLKEELSNTNRKVQRIISLQKLEFEIPLKRTYPIFIKENGEFHGTDSTKYVSKIVNYELGINFNFHALRHTHATMLVESGVNIKAIADRLGHSTTRTTLDTYVHSSNKLKTDAMDKFESYGDLNSTNK